MIQLRLGPRMALRHHSEGSLASFADGPAVWETPASHSRGKDQYSCLTPRARMGTGAGEVSPGSPAQRPPILSPGYPTGFGFAYNGSMELAVEAPRILASEASQTAHNGAGGHTGVAEVPVSQRRGRTHSLSGDPPPGNRAHASLPTEMGVPAPRDSVGDEPDEREAWLGEGYRCSDMVTWVPSWATPTDRAWYPCHIEENMAKRPRHASNKLSARAAIESHCPDKFVIPEMELYHEQGSLKHVVPDPMVIVSRPMPEDAETYLAWRDPPIRCVVENCVAAEHPGSPGGEAGPVRAVASAGVHRR